MRSVYVATMLYPIVEDEGGCANATAPIVYATPTPEWILPSIHTTIFNVRGYTMRQIVTRNTFICLLVLAVVCTSGLRAQQDGTLDAGFGTNGEILVTAGLGMTGNAMALQPDGKIIAGGTLDTEVGVDFILARYTTTGTLDLSFGVGGTVSTDMGAGVNDLQALALQPDGKIVVTGLHLTETESHMALARYNTDGSLDTSFDTDGLLATNFGEAGSAMERR